MDIFDLAKNNGEEAHYNNIPNIPLADKEFMVRLYKIFPCNKEYKNIAFFENLKIRSILCQKWIEGWESVN